MIVFVKIFKHSFMSLFLAFLLVMPVKAQMCDLEDSEFPEEDCSFVDLGANIDTIKFGRVDRDNGPTVDFGNARFDLNFDGAAHVVSGDDCNNSDIRDVPGNAFANEDVAFIPNATNPRVIEEIWILDCTIVQDR